MKKFKSSINLAQTVILLVLSAALNAGCDGDLVPYPETPACFLSAKAHYSYLGDQRAGISFDLYGTNKKDANAFVGILTIKVCYLDKETDRYVEVYKFTQTDNGVISANSDMTDLRLGGNLDGKLFSFWDDRFEYCLEVKSDNPALGTIRIIVKD